MTTLRRLLASALVALALGATLSACAPAADPLDMSTVTAIIDVRTPEEFASGHLEGAVNVDVQSATFDEQIAQFSVDGDYVVYCRSGNRSAAAIDRMTAAGFTSLVNAGSVQQAADLTGLAVVN